MGWPRCTLRNFQRRAPNRLLEELNEVLFEDFGLAGNLGDYYNNSGPCS